MRSQANYLFCVVISFSLLVCFWNQPSKFCTCVTIQKKENVPFHVEKEFIKCICYNVLLWWVDISDTSSEVKVNGTHAPTPPQKSPKPGMYKNLGKTESVLAYNSFKSCKKWSSWIILSPISVSSEVLFSMYGKEN